MSKNLRKIRIFERLKNEKISQDPDFMVNSIVKPSTIEESDPILRLSLFYRHIFEKKKFFVCTAGLPISEKKKNSTRRKNFFSPPPNIEEYVLQINQSDRCLEDT